MKRRPHISWNDAEPQIARDVLTLGRIEGSRTAKALFWAATLFTLVMALIPQPPPLPGSPSDKLQHAAAFATLSVLGRVAFPRLPILRLIVSLSLFGAFIELAQALPFIHRDCDVLDWLTDTLACATILVPMGWWRERKR